MPTGRPTPRPIPCCCRSSCITRSSPINPARTPSSRGSSRRTSNGWPTMATRRSSWRTSSPTCATARRCRKSPSFSALTTDTIIITSMSCRCCSSIRRGSFSRSSDATRMISPSGRARASTMRTSRGASSTRCSTPASSRCRTTRMTCTPTHPSGTAACRTGASRTRPTRNCSVQTSSACRMSSRSTPAARRTPLPIPTASTAT